VIKRKKKRWDWVEWWREGNEEWRAWEGEKEGSGREGYL